MGVAETRTKEPLTRCGFVTRSKSVAALAFFGERTAPLNPLLGATVSLSRPMHRQR